MNHRAKKEEEAARGIAELHARIRAGMEAHRRKLADREESLRLMHGYTSREKSMLLQEGDSTAEQVNYGCDAVNRLLDELVVRRREDDYTLDTGLFGAADPPANPGSTGVTEDEGYDRDLLDDVQTLRTLASDDASLESNSVADYSEEPPAAPAFASYEHISAIATELVTSHSKVVESLQIITSILAASPHWWTSTIVMRRLKTHSVRMEYHARKIRKWAIQCRTQLFVLSSILNRTSAESTADMAELRSQLESLRQRKQSLVQSKAAVSLVAAEIEQAGAALQRYQKQVLETSIRAAANDVVQRMSNHSTAPDKLLEVEDAEAVLLLAVAAERIPDAADSARELLRFFSSQ